MEPTPQYVFYAKVIQSKPTVEEMWHYMASSRKKPVTHDGNCYDGPDCYGNSKPTDPPPVGSRHS